MTPEFRVWDGQEFDYCTLRARKGFSPQENGIWYDLVQTHPKGVVFGTLVIKGEEEIEQYTGLKDKDGNKIFEGDVLKVSDGENFYVAPVRYHSADNYPAFDIDIRYVPSDWNYDDNIFSEILNYGEETMEVVGNIHKDSDLIDN